MDHQGHLAANRLRSALGRLMSKSVDKCQPFFRILKRRVTFKWDEKPEVAFQSLKDYLSHLPRIASPNQGEPLLLYLAVSDQAVSAILVEKRARDWVPIYYCSHALIRAKFNYSLIEKFICVLVLASR